jgi:hypothetical protein
VTIFPCLHYKEVEVSCACSLSAVIILVLLLAVSGAINHTKPEASILVLIVEECPSSIYKHKANSLSYSSHCENDTTSYNVRTELKSNSFHH